MRAPSVDRRRWSLFVDVGAVGWLAPFAVALAVRFTLAGATTIHVGLVCLALTVFPVVFPVDLVILYRWSVQSPRALLRDNRLLVLTVVPWVRSLRTLRVARGMRAMRALVCWGCAGATARKARQAGARLVRSPAIITRRQ